MRRPDWRIQRKCHEDMRTSGRIVGQPVQRRVHGRKRTAVRRAIRSHRPSRSGRRCSAASASPPETESVKVQAGFSGPASGSWIARLSPGAAEKTRDWSGTMRKDGCVVARVARRRAETSEVLPWGSVAVAVMIGSPAGGVKGTSKTAWPWRRSSPPAIRGSPGPDRHRLGRSRRWRRDRCGTSYRACCRRASPRAGRLYGHDNDGEVLEVIGSLAG